MFLFSIEERASTVIEIPPAPAILDRHPETPHRARNGHGRQKQVDERLSRSQVHNAENRGVGYQHLQYVARAVIHTQAQSSTRARSAVSGRSGIRARVETRNKMRARVARVRQKEFPLLSR